MKTVIRGSYRKHLAQIVAIKRHPIEPGIQVFSAEPVKDPGFAGYIRDLSEVLPTWPGFAEVLHSAS